jgi:hypothetical protein
MTGPASIALPHRNRNDRFISMSKLEPCQIAHEPAPWLDLFPGDVAVDTPRRHLAMLVQHLERALSPARGIGFQASFNAEDHFLCSLDFARVRGALSWELRAQ